MNTTIFSKRLQECRKRKFSSQQAFADAYMDRFGMIRQGKKNSGNNMFGTVQSWEQGKSTPTADVLANICDLLDCDADYLLNRIEQKTHEITTAQRYTGLSASALEQLHEYRINLENEPDWAETRELQEHWSSHKYYQAFALYLIDELLTGSESHKLAVGRLNNLFEMIEEGVGSQKEDYEDNPEGPYNLSDDEKELLAAQTREEIDIITYLITNNIRDILYENCIKEKLPEALKISDSSQTEGCSFFSVY